MAPLAHEKLRKMKSNTTNKVRIGAGTWRSRIIRFPDADGLRPTPDRVRATVFNWLGQSLTGKVCLDAFAGSGALGFEAASRGAEKVFLCESNALALTGLRENATLLQASRCQIVAKDVLQWLKNPPIKFDVVFCDPPFNTALTAPFLTAIAKHLTPTGVIYLESGAPFGNTLMIGENYEVLKSSKAGAVHFGLLRLKPTG